MSTIHQRIRDVLTHTDPPTEGFRLPHLFYLSTGAEIMGALNYIERKVFAANISQSVADRHLGRIRRTTLVEIVENFERFVKQTAARCIDTLAPYIIDDRLDKFTVKGSALAAHFDAGGVGDALCESGTWLDTEEINRRYRKILDWPGSSGPPFEFFPKDPPNQPDFSTLELIWQLRHSVVHNVGLITRSDATKLRVLSKSLVLPEVVLAPTRADLGYLKVFLDSLATTTNRRTGERLAEVLTTYLQQTPGLFDAQQMADSTSTRFQLPLTIHGAIGVVMSPLQVIRDR